MHIIFCADPLTPRAVDAAYAEESRAAIAAGFQCHLLNFEQLVHE